MVMVNAPTGPLTVTNASSLATVTRSQGATVTWRGGFPGGDVQVEGDNVGSFGATRFYCHAPSNAGQLTIPAVHSDGEAAPTRKCVLQSPHGCA
jgi:hypothetical protein